MEQPFDLVQMLGVSTAQRQLLSALNASPLSSIGLRGHSDVCIQLVHSLSPIDTGIQKFWRKQCPLGFGNAPKIGASINAGLDDVVKAVKATDGRDGSWSILEVGWFTEKFGEFLLAGYSQQEIGINPSSKPKPDFQTEQGSLNRPVPIQHSENSSPSPNGQLTEDIENDAIDRHGYTDTHESLTVIAQCTHASYSLPHETDNEEEIPLALCETSLLSSAHDDYYITTLDMQETSPVMKIAGQVDYPSSGLQGEHSHPSSECAELGEDTPLSTTSDLYLVEQDAGHGEDSACTSPLEEEHDRYWEWDARAQRFRHWDDTRSSFIYCPESFA